MSTFFKPLLVLVISLLLFAGFFWLTDNELLEFIQARFYNPSVLNSYIKENVIDADIVENHIFYLQRRFAASLNYPAIRSSFLHNQNAEDIFERSRIYGMMLETTIGLQSVQFVDSNGIRIHFSTSPRDIISQNNYSTAYRNYNEDPLALPFETVSVPSGSYAKFTMDDQTDRIVYSFPFNDSMEVYRGTALFTVSVRALTEKLIAEGRLEINENVSILGDPPGVLLGIPRIMGVDSSRTEILEKISAIWNNEMSHVTIDSEESGIKFSLVSSKTHNGLFFGRLINDYLFSIPASMKLLLNLSIFISFYLLLFFLSNLKANKLTVVRNRIKNLREKLFEQLYVNKSNRERAKWILELEQRRDEIKLDIKRNLKLKSHMEKNVDIIIDNSWDELLTVIKSGSSIDIPDSPIQHEALEVLEEVETLEEIEEIQEAEALEEIEEIQEAEALEEIETLEEIEEIQEAEALEEAETLEKIEEIEEKVEGFEKTEALEEIDDIEILEESELISAIEEIKNIDDIKVFEGFYLEPADEETQIGLLRRTEKKIGRTKKGGLLATACKYDPESESISKGLLASASEFDFSSIYETVTREQEDQNIWDSKIDIVSPFSSMFESLKENNE
ncbi:MAG: hypothetical protein LBC80_05885 [Treponema sp.]|nr:hypothetical protein [Treponema sp.]